MVKLLSSWEPTLSVGSTAVLAVHKGVYLGGLFVCFVFFFQTETVSHVYKAKLIQWEKPSGAVFRVRMRGLHR